MKDEEEKTKKMALKDEYGSIAIQTSSQTLPKEEGSRGMSKRET